MTPEKKTNLEARGWRIGTAAEFLGLTPEEEAEVERMVNMSQEVTTNSGGQAVVQLRTGDYAHWYDETWRCYRCGAVVSSDENKTALWMSDLTFGRESIWFVQTALLSPGHRTLDELRKMTLEEGVANSDDIRRVAKYHVG